MTKKAVKRSGLPEVARPSQEPEAVRRLAKNPEQSRLSIDIPTDLHKRIKHKSTDERRSIRDLVVEVLEERFP